MCFAALNLPTKIPSWIGEAYRIAEIDGIIETIRKQIVTQETTICTNKNRIIRIDEPPYLGIVVTALEIIQPGLYVVDLAMND